MQIALNSPQEAVEFFERLHDEVLRTGDRTSMGVKLDSVPSMPGAVHKFDGSTVTVWYRSANKPTDRQIREATVAVGMMGIPRDRFTGKLIDARRTKDGSVFFLCGGVLERRDEGNNGMPAFRAFNPSKGQVLSMSINTEVTVTQPVRGVRMPVHGMGKASNGAANGAMV